MNNLYELSQALEHFDFEFDEETGELLNAEEYDGLISDRNEKIRNCIYWLKNKQAEAEALKNAKMDFAKRQSAAEKSVERMKGYIELCLNGEKWQSEDKLNKVSYRKSEVVMLPENIYEINSEFLKYSPPTADKTAIKKAIKNGQNVDGCYLVEKQNIQIV